MIQRLLDGMDLPEAIILRIMSSLSDLAACTVLSLSAIRVALEIYRIPSLLEDGTLRVPHHIAQMQGESPRPSRHTGIRLMSEVDARRKLANACIVGLREEPVGIGG
jgi:hypothetical protein